MPTRTAPKTLAQAIERVCTIEEGGAPYAGLSDAIAELGEARRRLDGLEENRATLELRTKAYERALELAKRIEDPTGQDAERVIEIARFLAPAWAELEDPLGPTESHLEAEAAQASAEAMADALRDDLAAAEEVIGTQRDRIAELVLKDAERSTELERFIKLAADRGLELMEVRDDLRIANERGDAWRDQIAPLEAELERLRRAWLTRIFVPTAPDPVGP